jgi:hypothetical protein
MIYKDFFNRIKDCCLKGNDRDIRYVISLLNSDVDLPTTRAIDFYLGMVEKTEGVEVLKEFLFEGTQIQRNYCTLYFARRDEWSLVNRAYELGLIDVLQAYSR